MGGVLQLVYLADSCYKYTSGTAGAAAAAMCSASSCGKSKSPAFAVAAPVLSNKRRCQIMCASFCTWHASVSMLHNISCCICQHVAQHQLLQMSALRDNSCCRYLL
jgi:hypothetical protein